MKNSLRNIFFVIGVVAILFMLFGMDMTYEDVVSCLRKAGIWFPVLLLLWAFIYMINTGAWYAIICNGLNGVKVPFMKVYKYTVTGFALNSTTPVGLMGGEPYRIMELKPYVGIEKATSSVILYVMMHIFSHFCFWLFSLLIYILSYYNQINKTYVIIMSVFVVACSVGIYFFIKGYRSGMVMKLMRFLQCIPFIKQKVKRLVERKEETFVQIDNQIKDLYRNNKYTFFTSLSLEFMARIVSCAEVYIILQIFSADASYFDSILILAFTSLFANLMFFSPMQLGAREGGFVMSVALLSIPYSYGVFMALLIRIREVVCVIIGIALMKIGNK